MEIQERVPRYIDLGPNHVFPVFTVATIEELLGLDFVMRWMSHQEFSYWSYSPANKWQHELLMANMTTGKYWATARVRNGSLAELGLPMWKE